VGEEDSTSLEAIGDDFGWDFVRSVPLDDGFQLQRSGDMVDGAGTVPSLPGSGQSSPRSGEAAKVGERGEGGRRRCEMWVR
jgi:hypothetical protein